MCVSLVHKFHLFVYAAILVFELVDACLISNGNFQEYDDERDADDAIRAMDGIELDGARIIVEASHGGRDGERRRGPAGDECFSCGGRGHW